MFTSAFSDVDFRESFAALTIPVEKKIEFVLREVGIETIAYLRKLTGELRPPWPSAGGPNRPAHPGHWADRTGNLANAYGWEVSPLPDGFVLALYNTMEYAVYLEAHDGFFVLSGVTERGGPVEKAVREAIATIAPEWTVINLNWRAA